MNVCPFSNHQRVAWTVAVSEINLARYIIRPSFSQERMTNIPEESKVIYQSKDSKEEKGFDADI